LNKEKNSEKLTLTISAFLQLDFNMIVFDTVNFVRVCVH